MNTAIELVRICFDSIMEQDMLPADLPEVQDLQNAILNLEKENLSLRRGLNRTVGLTDNTLAELDAARQEIIFLKRLVTTRDETIEKLKEELSETQALKDEIKALKNQTALVESEALKKALEVQKEELKAKDDTIARAKEIAHARDIEIKRLKTQVIKLTMENNKRKKLGENDIPESEFQPDRSAADEATINRFKELMGDIKGLSVEDITERFLIACTTLAIEEKMKK